MHSQIGPSGTVNAYIVNRRFAWTQKRDNIRYALFDASIIVSDEEHPDQSELGQQSPLNQLPKVFSGERQLPSGDGLEPPSEPALPGMEPDLPALREPERRAEPLAIGELLASISATPEK